MDVIVKGRRTGVTERFRQYVATKLSKVERLEQKVVRVDVEVSQERNPRLSGQRERVELTIRSRGPVIRAEAAADDRFAAFDLAIGKLDARLRKLRDRRKIHRGNHTPVSLAAASAALAPREAVTAEATVPSPEEPKEQAEQAPVAADTSSEAATPGEQVVPIPTEGDAPLIVREKFHHAHPMALDQALFEMELVGHDFFLFRDRDNGHPSVVYRRRGYDYGVIRLVED